MVAPGFAISARRRRLGLSAGASPFPHSRNSCEKMSVAATHVSFLLSDNLIDQRRYIRRAVPLNNAARSSPEQPAAA